MTSNRSRVDLLKWNEYCHHNNIAFIAGDSLGLFGWIFNDLGNEFTCVDPDGENPKTAFIESITQVWPVASRLLLYVVYVIIQDKDGVLTVVESKRHDLEDGDVIKITEVEGMTELNGTEIKVTVKTPFQLGIGDTSGFSRFVKGGHIQQVKVPKKHSFVRIF